MTRFKIVVGILLILLYAVVISYAQGVQGDSHLGTWMVTVTPPAASGRPPFNALITFAGGGTLIVSTQNDHLGNSGIQQGTWRRQEQGTIASTQLYFVYAPTGVALGTVKVRATYMFSDEDNLTGNGEMLRCDLAGSNCTALPGLAALQGTKVQVEDIVGP